MNIKKIIAGLSAFATAFTLCTAIDGNTLSASDATYYIVGDANEDDKLNVRDAAYIASALSKGKASELYISADYNQDNSINVRDAAGIARYCAESYSSDIPVTTVPLTTTTTVGTMIITATTTTTTVTDVPVENITEPVTTTEVTIPDLPVETTKPVTTTEVTETTVTTTSEPVETTTVTTTTQIVETTVSDNDTITAIVGDYVICYSINSITEEHSISHNEEVNETKWFYDWSNGKYPDYTVEALTKRYGEDWNATIDANTALHQWYIDVIGKNHAGWFTRWNIIGWEYRIDFIAKKDVYEKYGDNGFYGYITLNGDYAATDDGVSLEDFTAATGIELPLNFTSSRLVDADGNIHDAWEDGRYAWLNSNDNFWCPTSNSLPDYGNYNVVEHLDELIDAPVIYYR